jgi:hypothetical protein
VVIKTRLSATTLGIAIIAAITALGSIVGGGGQQIAFAEVLDLEALFDKIDDELDRRCQPLEQPVRGVCQAIPVVGPG